MHVRRRRRDEIGRDQRDLVEMHFAEHMFDVIFLGETKSPYG
jgi:hypothetical protein